MRHIYARQCTYWQPDEGTHQPRDRRPPLNPSRTLTQFSLDGKCAVHRWPAGYPACGALAVAPAVEIQRRQANDGSLGEHRGAVVRTG
jgi:hypothetical protein